MSSDPEGGCGWMLLFLVVLSAIVAIFAAIGFWTVVSEVVG